AATNDDVADVADLALALAAFVSSRFPAEERGVERDGLLVVGDFERDVIEPHGFPARWLEGRRRRRLAAGRTLAPALAAAAADLQVEGVGILHVEPLEVLAVVVGNRRQPAFAQFRFDFLRVPRFDAPAETVEHGEPRGARRAAGAATASSLRSGVSC